MKKKEKRKKKKILETHQNSNYIITSIIKKILVKQIQRYQKKINNGDLSGSFLQSKTSGLPFIFGR
jgi:hypothetical protein